MQLNTDSYLSQHSRRNYVLYMLVILFSLCGSSFGDMSVFVPSLAMRLHAPSWLVALPMVAGLSIAYAPTLIVAWLLGPRTSRAKAYAWSVALMYIPILVLAIFLFRGGSNEMLLPIFAVAIVMYSVAMGVTILPCWDLFSRIFAEHKRSKIVGHANALGQVATLLSAGIAAWLISPKSPLPMPKNYAAAMLIFSTLGLFSAITILRMKEYIPVESDDGDRSFRAFLKSVRSIIRNDRPFIAILKPVALAYMVAAVFPIILSHAERFCGFSESVDVPILVATRPYVAIPSVLAFGYIAQWIGPARLASILAAVISLAIPLAMTLSGRWQLLPIFLVMVGESMSTYALLAVMKRAKPGLMHQYLAIYFTACMIPGLSPLALAWLLDRAPRAAMLAICFIAAIAAIGLFFIDRNRADDQIINTPITIPAVEAQGLS